MRLFISCSCRAFRESCERILSCNAILSAEARTLQGGFLLILFGGFDFDLGDELGC
jgi:hypothetical protein